MLPRVIDAVQCCFMLHVGPGVIMLCSVVACYLQLLHAVQCCYTLHCVVEFYAAVLYVVMCSCMLCSVVTCYQE